MSRLMVVLLVAGALAALGGISLYRLGFNSSEEQQERTEFAQDRAVDGKPVAFDTKRAMGYLEEVCKIGPRISGTPGMKRQQELLQKHFEKLGGKVSLQRFPARQKSQPQPIEMANLIVTWHPERQRRVLLCAHYDTRPIADEEADPKRWRQPFLAANDGGSGVAFFMELAHHMKELKTPLGVDFVLFDGEEYIFDRDRDEYFLGSTHFASSYSRAGHRYRSAVLVDMIAGKNARFYVEQNSWFLAGPLVQEVWKIAAELKCNLFIDERKHEVRDDHLPLNRVGIPAIDIIDFDYPHWHKLSDVPANCAGEGMEQVARVLSVWLQRVK
jgi:glutaminyl-peptide cyclotransferase